VAKVSLEHIIKAIKLFGSIDLRMDNYSTLPLELALVESSLQQVESTTSPAERPAVKKEPMDVPQHKAAAQKAPTKSSASKEPIAETGAPPRPTVPKAPEPSQTVPAVPVPEPVLSINVDKQAGVEPFRQHWAEFVRSVRGLGSAGNLDAFLRDCKPLNLEGDTLVLGFPYAFHKDKIENPKYKIIIEKRLSEVFGSAYKVRCVLAPREKKAPGSQLNNPLVKAAVEMGAVIVEEPEEK
jgi:hypothetical protein